MTPLHAAARKYAQAGLPIFPVEANGKRPLPGSNGFKDATTDLDQIDLWWTLDDFNIAMVPESAGLCVIDVDGEDGENALFELDLEFNTPPTRMVATPSGGRHLYFRGSLPPSARSLGAGLDTRGRDSYVLVPPSAVGGRTYQTIDRTKPADLPPWVHGRLLARSQRTANHAVADLRSADADAFNLRRVHDILEQAEPAVIGAGSDEATLRLASQILDFVSPSAAADLMWEHWVPRCGGGDWDFEWLQTKVGNAANYRDNPIGCDFAPPVATAFKDHPFLAGLTVATEPDKGVPSSGRFALRTIHDVQALPPVEYIIPGFLPRGGLNIIAGIKESFKSFQCLDLALSEASGRTPWGQTPSTDPQPAGIVIYATEEGEREILGKRRKAWQLLHGAEDWEIEGTIFQTGCPMLGIPGDRDQFVKMLEASDAPIKHIVFDHFGYLATGLKEFDPATTMEVRMFAKFLIAKFGCTVTVVQHANADGTIYGGQNGLIRLSDAAVTVERPDKGKRFVKLKLERSKDTESGAEIMMEGHLIADSLAFAPVDPTAYQNAVQQRNLISGPAIYAALERMKAVDAENFTTTHALAATLVSMDPTLAKLTGEDREKLVRITEKRLKKDQPLLIAYSDGDCQNIPGGIKWYLHPITADDTS